MPDKHERLHGQPSKGGAADAGSSDGGVSCGGSHSPQPPRAAVWRLRAALFGLLSLMLFALWYDYNVARVAVLDAYDKVAEMNRKMNVASEAVAMRSVDVQRALGKLPSRTFSEGPYRIEVFSWVGGLPFRTHDLYAVYLPQGNDLLFMMEYPYSLPFDELQPPVFPGEDSQDDPYLAGYPGIDVRQGYATPIDDGPGIDWEAFDAPGYEAAREALYVEAGETSEGFDPVRDVRLQSDIAAPPPEND